MALTDQIVAYWKLDGNGNDSVASFNMTAQGSGFTYVAAKINTGADLERNNPNYMSSTASASFSSAAYSVAFWINGETLGASVYYIFSKCKNTPTTAGYAIYSTSNGKIILQHFVGGADPTLTSTATLSTATWYHVVITYASGTATIYINGASDNSGSLTAFNASTNGQFIGSDDQASNTFDGIVDEVGYWSRALTSTEVSKLYNSGSGFSYPFQYTITTNETSTGTEAVTATYTRVILQDETSTGTESLNVTSPAITWSKQTENTSSWANQTKH